MPRFEIQNGPIRVAYGFDADLDNVFLSVFDERLAYDPEATDAVNAVSNQIGVQDGGGSYFDLHTGHIGFGIKVNHKTMATFLRRYGVTKGQISALPLNLSTAATVTPNGTKKCASCHLQAASRRCARCRAVFYCCRECQVMDWQVHKIFCGISTKAPGSSASHFTKGILFPEEEKEPFFVILPMTRAHDGRIDSSECFPTGTIVSSVRSDYYHEFEHLEWLYVIFFKDDALIDDISQENQCVKLVQQKYLEKQQGSVSTQPRSPLDGTSVHWRNNIVVLKAKKPSSHMEDPQMYEDITLADVPEVVAFVVELSIKYTS